VNKKAGLPFPGNPAVFGLIASISRSVAFRPSLTAGLVLSQNVNIKCKRYASLAKGAEKCFSEAYMPLFEGAVNLKRSFHNIKDCISPK
jgi:hypothetical protein